MGTSRITKQARNISDLVDDLDDVGKVRAIKTIESIVSGIANLGSLPPEIVNGLWNLMITVATKALFPSRETQEEKAKRIYQEITDGMSEDFLNLIKERAKE